MQIQNLTIRDYTRITDLWTRAGLSFRPRGRDSKETIAAEIRANPEFFLGAFEDGHLVGVAVLSSDARKGWINRLAIDPDYRRRGIAKALITESERILRKHGLRMFCALIDNDNTVSKELFRKSGYVEHRDIIYFSKRDNGEV
jgi:ribosomal protein S18 acetylase RimI-like enzyme